MTVPFLRSSARAIWLLAGFAALALACLGVALPLLPTTPFLLLAAFAFARSSTRLHDRLLQHAVFGPLIRDWQTHKAIAPQAKTAGILAILAVLVVSITLGMPGWIIGTQVIVLGVAAVFILSRPNPPKPADREQNP